MDTHTKTKQWVRVALCAFQKDICGEEQIVGGEKDETSNMFSRTKVLVFIVVSIDFVWHFKNRYQIYYLCVGYNCYKVFNQKNKNNQPINMFIYPRTWKKNSINI